MQNGPQAKWHPSGKAFILSVFLAVLITGFGMVGAFFSGLAMHSSGDQTPLLVDAMLFPGMSFLNAMDDIDVGVEHVLITAIWINLFFWSLVIWGLISFVSYPFTEQPQADHNSNILLAVIALAAFLGGVGDGFLQGSQYDGDHEAYFFGKAIVYSGLAFVWYHADAKRRGRARSLGMSVAIIAITIIGIPVYLFRSRGAARGVQCTILFLGFFVGCFLLSGLGTVLAAVACRIME